MTPQTRALIEAAEESLDRFPYSCQKGQLTHCRCGDCVEVRLRAAISSAKAAEEGVESGTKVFLIRGMQKKPAFIVQTRTAHCIDGRWYWADGTAVDGSAMRWEAKEKAPEGT